MMPDAYIHTLDDPRGWRYGSGLALYTERLVDGRLLCASHVDNGLPVYPEHESRATPAFDLVINGESLAFGWEYVSFSVEDGVGTLTLRHERKPVELQVITRPGGGGFLRRTLRITNTGDAALGLTSVAPLCGELWPLADGKAENLHDLSPSPCSAGYFRDIDWGNEGNFAWQDVPRNAALAFSSTRGRSGHNHPFFVLRDNHYGGYLLCSLAWSANWRLEVEHRANRGDSTVRFAAMPAAAPPMRVIAPGETVTAPDVHFGLNHEDLDALIQAWHAYLRGSVLKQVGDGRQPVIFNHWGYMQHEMDEERLKAEIDLAAEIGAELFMVDAGWYGDRDTAWWNTTGNWQAGDRLPNDLFPVYEYARQQGLQTGLWVEIESAGSESRLAKEHPDWFITRYGQPVERVLDLAKPAVRDYVRSEIIRLVERYQLDMFRLDYNLDAREGGFNEVDGRLENTLWRHVEAIYEIFDEVGRCFPHLQLENCSSGGGRTDVGQVSRFTTTWVSDWMLMPRTARILNGMSLALPPEYLDRLFGAAMQGSYHGNLETQLHVVILAHPCISGLTPTGEPPNPAALALVKKYVGIYKDFIRPFHRAARVYHHTPVIPGADGEGWCALEYAAEDRARAVAGVFRLLNAEEEYRFRFRGLDPGTSYRLAIEPGGQAFTASGNDLMRDGLPIRLDTALTSRLILAERA